MIAADHDGRVELAVSYHLIERKAETMPLAEPDPADARRQALELDTRAGHVQPAMQMWIVGNQFFHFRVGALDVARIA